MTFDVVIFDEASRISSADAVNCVYRGGSVIVAGDERQLPPASFSTALDDGGAEFEEAANPESVLDRARRSGAFGDLTLRWHYRSRDEALIAYSNAAFYDGRLLPVPAADGGPETGIGLFYGEGTYRSRTTRDNPGEAARVAQRIVHHYRTRPALSLGVVALSEAQARAIETALGEARNQHPDLDRFFGTDRLRGFFVKNADAAQGDERDVLILSVGYGPDEAGHLTTDFGPLAGPDGWRRLNVAVTRARYRAEIVSSIHASDIPEAFAGEGLKQLRGYLSYAAGKGGPE
jgi:superfamily I DNA and/or RNA helicase